MTTVSVVCSMCSKNLERTQFSRTQLKKGSKKKCKNCIKGFHQIQSKKNQPESQDKHQETFVTTKYEIKFWDCPRCDKPNYDITDFYCLNCRSFIDKTAIHIKIITKLESKHYLDLYQPKQGLEFLVWGFIRLFYETLHGIQSQTINDCNSLFITNIVPTSIKFLIVEFYFIMDSKILPLYQQFGLVNQILSHQFKSNNKNMKIHLLLHAGYGSDTYKSSLTSTTFNEICGDKTNTLTIIESNKDFIFGAYLTYKWEDYFIIDHRRFNKTQTVSVEAMRENDESFLFLLSKSGKLQPKIFGNDGNKQRHLWRLPDYSDTHMAFGQRDIVLFESIGGMKCYVNCRPVTFNYKCGDLCGGYHGLGYHSGYNTTLRVDNCEVFQIDFKSKGK